MKKLKKKGQFGIINAGMLTFLTFVAIVITIVFMTTVLVKSDLVCDGTYDDGGCFKCNGTTGMIYNASDNICHDTDANGTTSSRHEAGTDAYNGTINMRDAGNLAPQFAEVLMITIIIVGILGMLAVAGFVGYAKYKG